MGKNSVIERGGVLIFNNFFDFFIGSGYNIDVFDDNLSCDRISFFFDINGNLVLDE